MSMLPILLEIESFMDEAAPRGGFLCLRGGQSFVSPTRSLSFVKLRTGHSA